MDTAPTLKVITVDDSPLIAERVKLLLSDLECVEFLGNAGNIVSAIELVKRKNPDVAVLDIHLGNIPSANGINLLKTLRKDYPNMIIIMLTNLSDPQYRTTCLNLGANYFFDKTNDFEKVPETLKLIQQLKNAKKS